MKRNAMQLVIAPPLAICMMAGLAYSQSGQTTQERRDRQVQEERREMRQQDQQRRADNDRRGMVEYLTSHHAKGADIVDPTGEQIGQVGDLIVDLHKGKIPYAIVEFGGFLGIGADKVAVPIAALRWDAAEEQFVLNTTEEQLENAPEFDPDNWDQLEDDSWLEQVREIFGDAMEGQEEREGRDQRREDRGESRDREDRAREDRGRDADRDRDRRRDQERRQRADRERDADNDWNRYMMLSDFDDAEVYASEEGEDNRGQRNMRGRDDRRDSDRDRRDRRRDNGSDENDENDDAERGEKVGTLEVAVFDRSNGRIDYVLLSTGGVLGIGAREHPVPWNALHRIDDKKFKLKVTNDRLDEAPELGRDEIYRLEHEADFRRTVHEFYGTEPREGASQRDRRDRDREGRGEGRDSREDRRDRTDRERRDR